MKLIGKCTTKYYIPNIEINHYNVIINGRNFFHQPVKNDLKHMITLERLQLVKEMSTQLAIY